MIQVQNLDLMIDRKPILQHIALSIPKGAICALVGHSGSGKSTLLRCLNRLYEPPPNTVFLENTDITMLDVLKLRRRVGLVQQAPVMFAGSVTDNVRYPAYLHGMTLTNEDVATLLDKVGIEQALWGQAAQTLSGGQAQRVALARTLANHPDVLLLDEPTSALDPDATAIVEETVRTLCQSQRMTVVWVSHAPEQVERIATQTVTLAHGRVVAIT